MIEVKSGMEVSFDMSARRQQLYRVRGTVLDSRTGQPPPANVNISLTYRNVTGGGGSFSSGRNYDPTTGKFELLNVIPGQYTVQVQVPDPPPPPGTTLAIARDAVEARIAEQAMRPVGLAPILVADADVENVTVDIRVPVAVSGRLAVEGQALSTLPNIDRIRINLRPSVDGLPVTAIGSNPSPGTIAADGTFQIGGLRESEYVVNVNTVPAGFYVKGVQYGGSDVLNKPWRFSGAASGNLDVVLRPGVSRITGTLTDAQSQPVPSVQVVLVPEQRNRTELYRTAVADQNGRFSLTGLTPGAYRLFGWESFEPSMQYDPEVLKRFEPQSRLIQLSEAADQTVDLRVIPAEK